MQAIQIETTVRAPQDIVWKAWTESDQVATWFSPDAIIEAQPGGRFELFFDPSNHDHQCTKGCVFTLVEQKKRLGFTWKGPDQFADLMNDPTPSTSVRVSFFREDDITRVVVEHSGWGQGEEWEEARTWHERAWLDVLGRLKSTLESVVGSQWE